MGDVPEVVEADVGVHCCARAEGRWASRGGRADEKSDARAASRSAGASIRAERDARGKPRAVVAAGGDGERCVVDMGGDEQKEAGRWEEGVQKGRDEKEELDVLSQETSIKSRPHQSIIIGCC